MQRITTLTTDHPAILEGLDVLRLIADHVEAGDAVEPEDIGIVLDFLRDVGCACLDHTASLILRPALKRAREKIAVQRLRSALACHEVVRPLLDETAVDLDFFQSLFVHHSDLRTKRVDSLASANILGEPEAEFPGCFVLHVRLLTELVEDLIIQEDAFLLKDAVNLLADPDGQLKIGEFADRERRISAIAVEGRPALHRLETKYAHP
jgi:hypothetical protein